MTDISSINSSTTQRARRVSVDPSTTSTSSTDELRGRGGTRNDDQVEISHVAQYLSQLQSEPAQRTDLIDRVRTQIESGTYLTDDKLSAAADELLDDINFQL
jgi:anti-sigma28 factor (negative regulator of flagellin synthesis)